MFLSYYVQKNESQRQTNTYTHIHTRALLYAQNIHRNRCHHGNIMSCTIIAGHKKELRQFLKTPLLALDAVKYRSAAEPQTNR